MVPDVQALKIAVEYQIVADRATQGSGAGRWKGEWVEMWEGECEGEDGCKVGMGCRDAEPKHSL